MDFANVQPFRAATVRERYEPVSCHVIAPASSTAVVLLIGVHPCASVASNSFSENLRY